MGAGLVMVVTVAAGIINVDMANIAAADGKTEIFGVGDGTRRDTTRRLRERCEFFSFFFIDSPPFRGHGRSSKMGRRRRRRYIA